MARNKEATAEEKAKIDIPDDMKPNFKAFYLAFSISNHLLLVEVRNELGHSFGPKRARAFFDKLFYLVSEENGLPGIEVTAIPEDDSVDRILGMFSLRHLKIVVVKPNHDVNTDKVNRILGKLEDNKAKKQITELFKEAGATTLTPDGETKDLALVASTNGYVEGQGKDSGGHQLAESTREHPKRIDYAVGSDQSSEAEFLARLDNFTSVARPPSGSP